MSDREAVRVRRELLEEVKKEVERSEYKSLSEFVSDAIQLRLQTMVKERIAEYLDQDRKIAVAQLQAELFCTSKHTFAQAAPGGNIRIGITDYFQSQIKEIVSVQTGSVGEEVFKGEPFGVAESSWFTYDLCSPLNGKIISINQKVIEDPLILNVEPYQWILEVQPKHTEVDSWMNGLLGLREYEELIRKHKGPAL